MHSYYGQEFRIRVRIYGQSRTSVSSDKSNGFCFFSFPIANIVHPESVTRGKY